MKKLKLITLLSFMLSTICLGQIPTVNDVLNKQVKGDIEAIELDNGSAEYGDIKTVPLEQWLEDNQDYAIKHYILNYKP